jgi:hypothetical protein
MYKRFQELLDIRGVTAYRVSKETGISPTVFSEWKIGVTVKHPNH